MRRSTLVLMTFVWGCSSDKGVTIHNSEPAAAILGPVDGTLFESDETITFEGAVEDAQTPPDQLEVMWATDRSGIIAEDVTADIDGMVFFATTGLTPGTHVVTLQVIDGGGKRASDTISIQVINDDDPPRIEAIEHPSGEESDTAQEGVDYEFEAIVSDPQDEAFDLILSVSIEEEMEDGGTDFVELCTAIPEASGLARCTASMVRGMKIIQFAVEDTDGNVTTSRAELDVIPTTVTDDDGDGFSEVTGDCDDTDEDVHPGAFELLNGADDDCDGIIDNNTSDYDDDGDGYSEAEGDCDDDDDTISPSASEECDGVDNDCDGEIDGEGTPGAVEYFLDDDGDTFGDPDESEWMCSPVYGYVEDDTDCDDLDPAIHPDAIEQCDEIDNNCDGSIDGADADSAVTTYRDLDGDGFGDPLMADTRCTPPEGFVTNASDCDDTDALSFPGSEEVCDSADNDCDSEIDEEDASGCTWYFLDEDGDAYGTSDTRCLCTPSDSYTSSLYSDCYDGNADANPAHTDFHTLDRGDGSFDYNCNSVEEKQITDVATSCGFFSDGVGCVADEGWDGSAAACGTTANWKHDCHYEWDWFSSGCFWRDRSETQACR